MRDGRPRITLPLHPGYLLFVPVKTHVVVIARLEPGDPVSTGREYWIARSSRAMNPDRGRRNSPRLQDRIDQGRLPGLHLGDGALERGGDVLGLLDRSFGVPAA